MGKKYQRRNGESLADFNARCRASQPSRMTPERAKRGGFTNSLWRLEERRRAAEKRIADRIDGFDRDDLGESPDF